MTTNQPKNKIGIVVPHIFMHRDLLPNVIFAPASLALSLAEGLQAYGLDITLFTPGPVDTNINNITADLSYFDNELEGRGDGYIDLLKKHPFTFVTLARQVQSELIAKAFTMANIGELDLVHIYTNEEDTALPFSELCQKPVLFTHHDPFNFLVKYKNVFPKYRHLNWVSMSYAQRKGMPDDTNWIGNVYHGVDKDAYHPSYESGSYFAYLGRIIQPKGVHLAIEAVKRYNDASGKKIKLKIAGKHYSGHKKDTYWKKYIEPQLGKDVEYVGFIKSHEEKQRFLSQAKALLVTSIFEEPFGMVMIESLACGTPVIGLDSGSIPEILVHEKTGLLVQKSYKTEADNQVLDETRVAKDFAIMMRQITSIDRRVCRRFFERHYTTANMCQGYETIYDKLLKNN